MSDAGRAEEIAAFYAVGFERERLAAGAGAGGVGDALFSTVRVRVCFAPLRGAGFARLAASEFISLAGLYRCFVRQEI